VSFAGVEWLTRSIKGIGLLDAFGVSLESLAIATPGAPAPLYEACTTGWPQGPSTPATAVGFAPPHKGLSPPLLLKALDIYVPLPLEETQPLAAASSTKALAVRFM
jgi:hypothetical protein